MNIIAQVFVFVKWVSISKWVWETDFENFLWTIFQSGVCNLRLIDLFSPRLHHGRAAFYGSTIVPLLHQKRYAGAACISVLVDLSDKQMDSRSTATGCTGSELWTCQAARVIFLPLLIKSHLKHKNLTLCKILFLLFTNCLITPSSLLIRNIQNENIGIIFQI